MNPNLSRLQMLQLNLLHEFVRVCEELHLRYYLVEGTMLGARRHHGFIPWDDDIDVGMPRKDYERFIREAPKHLSSRYLVSNYDRPDHYWMTVILFDLEHQVKLKNASEEIVRYAWIDIIPLDGMPRRPALQRMHYQHFYMYRVLYQISHFSKIVNVHKPRPFYQRLFIRFLQISRIEHLIDSRKVGDRLHQILSKYDFDTSDYVMQIISEYGMKELMPRSWFGKGRTCQFEDLKATGVSRPDRYLTRLYGDYRQLPPKEKRAGKHNVELITAP